MRESRVVKELLLFYNRLGLFITLISVQADRHEITKETHTRVSSTLLSTGRRLEALRVTLRIIVETKR